MYKQLILSLTLSVTLSACETLPATETLGTVLGGAAGGVLAKTVSGNENSEVWTVVGVAAGAYIGNRLARYLNERETEQVANSTIQTAETGKTSTWKNDDTGNKGTVFVKSEEVNASGKTCKTMTQQVVLSNGQSESQDLEMCRGNDGIWEIV